MKEGESFRYNNIILYYCLVRRRENIALYILGSLLTDFSFHSFSICCKIMLLVIWFYARLQDKIMTERQVTNPSEMFQILVCLIVHDNNRLELSTKSIPSYQPFWIVNININFIWERSVVSYVHRSQWRYFWERCILLVCFIEEYLSCFHIRCVTSTRATFIWRNHFSCKKRLNALS
jgi:hypothetical protein